MIKDIFKDIRSKVWLQLYCLYLSITAAEALYMLHLAMITNTVPMGTESPARTT